MLAGGLALILHRVLDYLKTPDGASLVGRWMPVRFVPVLALGVGVVIGVVDAVVAGQSLLHAVLFGGIPMLAVFLDRLLGAVKRPEAKKAIEKLTDGELETRLERLAGERKAAEAARTTRVLGASKALPAMAKQ